MASRKQTDTAEHPWLGIGFKPEYREPLLSAKRPLGWLEIHAENYMLDGGPRMALLDELAERYPISCHGVGLSIGGEAPLDKAHLGRLRALQDRIEPALFSEHLAWSTHGGAFFNDLLPLPYTEQTQQRVVDHIDQLQQALGRQILLENPSSYLQFAESTFSEVEFLAQLSERSGCGLLLDINNVYVSATNLGFSADDYLATFPLSAVGEIHLAGHTHDRDEQDKLLLIDTHSAPVDEAVWRLYERIIERLGAVPTLIEWDSDLPEWSVLREEVVRASRVIEHRQSRVA